ncbi:hypothetical protein EV667_1372 [Ancylobacter aquaticus]|uniref:Uncharacterized protein n=1 Tax=Ancylobacter aquaticus TaxID=100 RepID=A0A4R1IB52_ANCAQ|nr:hypothetical protein [Ancylobacter aquaticus]TCK31265.1 hypothetical protein EV667_1372 [Ancylobacter aquaticus]
MRSPPPTSHRPRIRAARSEERDAIIAGRAAALRPFLGRPPDGHGATLQRLLRAERRAAGSGVGYDAARHAALCRLLAEVEATPLPARPARHEKGRHPG